MHSVCDVASFQISSCPQGDAGKQSAGRFFFIFQFRLLGTMVSALHCSTRLTIAVSWPVTADGSAIWLPFFPRGIQSFQLVFIQSLVAFSISSSLIHCVSRCLSIGVRLCLCLRVCARPLAHSDLLYLQKNVPAGSFVYVHLSGYLSFPDG